MIIIIIFFNAYSSSNDCSVCGDSIFILKAFFIIVLKKVQAQKFQDVLGLSNEAPAPWLPFNVCSQCVVSALSWVNSNERGNSRGGYVQFRMAQVFWLGLKLHTSNMYLVMLIIFDIQENYHLALRWNHTLIFI